MRRLRWLVLALPCALIALPTATATAEDPPEPPPVTVTISTPATTYPAGQNFVATVKVRNGVNASVGIFAQLGGKTVQLNCGGTPVENDDFHCDVYTLLNTRIYVEVDGTEKASRTIKVRPTIGTAVKTQHTTKGRYAVLGRGVAPKFSSTSYPARPGQMCLRHEVQRLRAGAWRTTVVSGCRTEAAKGRVAWTWSGSHPRGVSFRVRGTFPGDSLNAAGPGAWTFFRFR